MSKLKDDSISDISELDPESEVLAPVQKRIEEQLKKHLQELNQQLRESKNEQRLVEKEREEYGVDLYNAQQHLAKLQETLEKQHERHAILQQQHDDKLQEREKLSAEAEAIQKANEEVQKQYVKFQDELGKLTETLTKIESYNEKLKGEVDIEKRAAHKTEDDISKLEAAKLKQDSLVSSLQSRINSLENEAATLQEQITSQREETKIARSTLAEASAEVEAINFEKKQLVQQWKGALVGMQRRQDAMKKTETALQQQKDELQVIENEISGFRKQIAETQKENTKLVEFMSRVDNEVSILDKKIDGFMDRKIKGSEAYTMLTGMIEKVDAENKKIEKDIQLQNAEVSEINKRIEKYSMEIAEMNKDILDHLSKQTSLKQESQGALSEIQKIKDSIRAKEQQVTDMENELARIRVDTLQSKAHNETLKNTLQDLEKELQSRGDVISRMQMDIKRRNEEIDRKQKQLDQLNHQYENIMKAHGAESGDQVGPLEATISSLSKAISAKSNENEALQQEWIKLQTEFVNCTNNINDIDVAIMDTQAKETILKQKRDRLVSAIAKQRQEITSLKNRSDAMHLEMKRVNTQLNKNAENKEYTANDLLLMEGDLVKRLEEKKRDAIKLERKVEEARQGKSDLLEQIMNCEKDILVWDRKLKIARETEMALDPTIGKAEVEKMKKEIGIMEKRIMQLKHEQRFLIEEMQKLIDHREIIRTKGQAAQISASRNKRGTTRLTVNKENAQLFKELTEKRQKAQEKEKQISESLATVEKTAAEVDQTQREIENLDEQIEQLQGQLAAMQKEHERISDDKMIKQNTLQRARDGEKGIYKLSYHPEDAEAEKNRLEENKRSLVELIENLSSRYPELAHDLQNLETSI